MDETMFYGTVSTFQFQRPACCIFIALLNLCQVIYLYKTGVPADGVLRLSLYLMVHF
jgi:hypothetical protein